MNNINMPDELPAINEYKSFKAELDAELIKAADGFVKIGYLLRRAEDTDILKESGYKNVAEFAAAEYGLTRDVVSRYININKKYSLNGYSDKLEDRYKGFGMAKLAEMLTLPAAISDVLPDDLSKSEIREIKKEYEAEQDITDIEVAIEAAELEASEQEAAGQGISKHADTDKYDVVYHIIKNWLHDNPQDFSKLCDGIEESKTEEFVKDIIAPDGTKVIITRVPGVGKLMMTCKADEGIEIVNMRSSETKKAEWSEVDDAVVFLCAKNEGETYKDVWQREYKEPYPEAIKEPEVPKEPKQSSKPKEKKTEKRKQSKVAVINKKEPDQLPQHEKHNHEDVAAVQEIITAKSEADNNKAATVGDKKETSDNRMSFENEKIAPVQKYSEVKHKTQLKEFAKKVYETSETLQELSVSEHHRNKQKIEEQFKYKYKNSYVLIKGYHLCVNTEDDELHLYDAAGRGMPESDKALETWDMQLMVDELEKVMNIVPMTKKERQRILEGYYDAYTDAFEMSKKGIRDEMFEIAQDYYLKAGEILEKIINLPESEEE